MLNERLETATGAGARALLQSLLGQVAIANAKQTYQRYQELCHGGRWQALAQQGAQTQRVLWASTSTKNPAYRDVMYVEELIGADTVNTIPPATIDAFRRVLRAHLGPDVAAGLATLRAAIAEALAS
jgi:transaldolase/glucose-6-phosphate isomerase